MELLDVYDESGRHLGVRDRTLVHRDGDWHRALHCWVLAVRDGAPVVLLQRRGPHTPWFPGRLDVSAAGHRSAGESAADAVREVEEELGLTVALEDLTFVARLPLDLRTGELWNREVNDVFALRHDQPLADYTFPDGSVTGLVEMPLAAFTALTVDGVTGRGRFRGADPTGPMVEVTVAPEDLVPLGRPYFTVLGAALQRLAASGA